MKKSKFANLAPALRQKDKGGEEQAAQQRCRHHVGMECTLRLGQQVWKPLHALAI